MRLLTIPLRCLRQKWTRACALLAVFLLGVASITALHAVSEGVGEGFERKLSAFGANIMISPRQDYLSVSYGGLQLMHLQVDTARIELDAAVAAMDAIPLRSRLAVVAPKLVGAVRARPLAPGTPEVPSVPVAVVGVDFANEYELKSYWSVDGRIPGLAPDTEAMALPFAPRAHGHEPPADSGTTDAPGAHPDGQGHREVQAAAGHASVHGTDFSEEARPLSPASLSELEVVVGHVLAERLGVRPGARLLLDGREARVAGVLDPAGNDDDAVLFMDIGAVQRMLAAPGQASFIEVAALCAGCPIEDIVAELDAALPDLEVKALSQVVAQRMYSINFARNLALLVALVILLSACAMVVMSMLAAVNERRREIGLLRAVGHSRMGVFIIFACEALVIGVVAGLGGYALGSAAGAHVLANMGLDVTDQAAFSLGHMVLAGLCAGGLAVVAAAVPACKAGTADPVTALTSL